MTEEQSKLTTKSWEPSQIQQALGAEKVPNIYTNNIQIGFSNWDAWLQFGEILGEHEGRLLIAPKLRVVMSLQHVKAFLGALQDSLMKFEATFGEIKMFVEKEDSSETKEESPEK